MNFYLETKRELNNTVSTTSSLSMLTLSSIFSVSHSPFRLFILILFCCRRRRRQQRERQRLCNLFVVDAVARLPFFSFR